LSDLWALLDWTTPGLLGTQAEFTRVEKAVQAERESGSGSDTLRRELQLVVEPFVLRRLKTDPVIAATLPVKIEKVRSVGLTRRQQDKYDAARDRYLSAGELDRSGNRQGAVMTMIARLRQIC